jgi:hypothetical protein
MTVTATHRYQHRERLLAGPRWVVAGAVLAANGLGWDIVGIRNGYDGLLFPDTYPEGGVVTFDARAIDAETVSFLANDRAWDRRAG